MKSGITLPPASAGSALRPAELIARPGSGQAWRLRTVEWYGACAGGAIIFGSNTSAFESMCRLQVRGRKNTESLLEGLGEICGAAESRLEGDLRDIAMSRLQQFGSL